MRIEIIACGILKDKNVIALINDYQRRMSWDITIKEINASHSNKMTADQIKDKESKEFEKHISNDAYIIVMDENGKNINSVDIAKHLEHVRDFQSPNKIQILIGGAFGFHKTILDQANYMLCFGKPTWPHMMVRLMLMEQLYRSQQILAGHPYHKE